ncbi:MAG: GxxExxY protein [Chloroflexota bacterium]|nr:GxxExxY protein [Chloroflexota bacterium]
MTGLVLDATENDLTYRIIGAAMAVHNAIGSGFREEVYERVLENELLSREISVKRQYQVEVHHSGIPVALFIIDLWVDELVIVELKAFGHQLTNDEVSQVINYLKATGAPVGLLFNFGRRKLEFRRVFPGPDASFPIRRLGRDNVKRASE